MDYTFIVIIVAFVLAILATWWFVINEPPAQKLRELALAIVGGIVGIAVLGGLVIWLCMGITGATHEAFHF